MTPKSRLFYNVEGQWREKGGIEVDLADVLLPTHPTLLRPIWKGCQKQKIHFGVRRCDAWSIVVCSIIALNQKSQ
ncbi:hypothetical protein MHU86_14621 [Fragilaria crotonensis]|nr:hypothetical protein MHU86_14621 [Fragilaria crotonensis]